MSNPPEPVTQKHGKPSISLRLAVARSQLITNVLETVGVSLRHRAIDCEAAMTWLKEEGLLDWLELGPAKVKS